MVILDPTFGYIWAEIGVLAKLCIVLPVLVGVYMLVSVLDILLRLHSLAKSRETENPDMLNRAVAKLEVTTENVRDLLAATFYVFWLLLFASFPNAWKVERYVFSTR